MIIIHFFCIMHLFLVVSNSNKFAKMSQVLKEKQAT